MIAAEAYPKMVYGPNGLSAIVGSFAEEQVLGPEWSEAPQATHLAVIGGQAPLAAAPAPAASPAPASAVAPDMNALAEQVALRVAEILAPLLPKRPGRPPNSES